jgi:hypothetical protein
MNKNNQFTVDLGNLKLTDAQRRSINAAIQGAVTKELGNIVLPNDIALVPVHQYLKGPIINGIILWEHRDILQQAEAQNKLQQHVQNQ